MLHVRYLWFSQLYSKVLGKMEDGIPRRKKVTIENKNQDSGPRLPLFFIL